MIPRARLPRRTSGRPHGEGTTSSGRQLQTSENKPTYLKQTNREGHATTLPILISDVRPGSTSIARNRFQNHKFVNPDESQIVDFLVGLFLLNQNHGVLVAVGHEAFRRSHAATLCHALVCWRWPSESGRVNPFHRSTFARLVPAGGIDVIAERNDRCFVPDNDK